MAKKTDLAAAKARKQKLFLIVGGVLLLGVAAIQGPKLMKHGSSPAVAATATAAAPSAGDAAASAATAATVPVPTTPTFVAAAYVAGVALPGSSPGPVTTSQLASFTLFDAKDPFLQQVGDGTGLSQDTAAATPDSGAPAAGPSATGAGTTPAVKPLPIAFATIMLDGKPQQPHLGGKKVDKEFPTAAPLFVLVSLKKDQAKIGVAGGSFDNGQTVTLKLRKTVTLADTATGVLYELKLVYTGTEAQVLEGFSTTPGQPAAPPAAPAPGATTAVPTTATP
jgi:hypothetical protein